MATVPKGKAAKFLKEAKRREVNLLEIKSRRMVAFSGFSN